MNAISAMFEHSRSYWPASMLFAMNSCTTQGQEGKRFSIQLLLRWWELARRLRQRCLHYYASHVYPTTYSLGENVFPLPKKYSYQSQSNNQIWLFRRDQTSNGTKSLLNKKNFEIFLSFWTSFYFRNGWFLINNSKI